MEEEKLGSPPLPRRPTPRRPGLHLTTAGAGAHSPSSSTIQRSASVDSGQRSNPPSAWTHGGLQSGDALCPPPNRSPHTPIKRAVSVGVPPSGVARQHGPSSLANRSNTGTSRTNTLILSGALTPKDHYSLSAWQKWRRFRMFPWKLSLHLLLVLFLTLQSLAMNMQDSPYTRSMYHAFRHFFRPVDATESDEYTIFTKQDLLDSLHKSTSSYFRLNNISTTSFLYRSPEGGNTATPAPFQMDLRVKGSEHKPDVTSYTVTGSDNIGPFSLDLTDEVSSLLDRTSYINLHMEVCNEAEGGLYRNCYCWRIGSTYDFSNGGNVRLVVAQHITLTCHVQTFQSYMTQDLNWINVLIMLFSLLYLALLMKSIFSSVALYVRVRRAYKRHRDVGTADPLVDRYSWVELPLGVKLRFVSPWLLIILAGNVCALLSVAINLSEHRNYIPSVLSHKVLAGLACLLLWTGGLRYLEHYRPLYELVPTINSSVPRLMPFLAGFLPIFIGYAVLGLSSFGQTVPWFSSIKHTLVTLWAVANADTLHQLINAMGSVSMPLAFLFMFSFVCVTIYVVMNIILGTVEEAYFSSRAVQRVAKRLMARAFQQLDDLDDNANGPRDSTTTDVDRDGRGGRKTHRARSSTLTSIQAEEKEAHDVFQVLLAMLVEHKYSDRPVD